MNIHDYGWDDFFAEQFSVKQNTDLIAGRVLREDRGLYKVITDKGIYFGEISGRLHYNALSKDELPVTGDWITAVKIDNDKLLIQDVLHRKTVFARKEAGKSSAGQILAVNIDTIFIMTSVNANFNLRRIERYMILAKSSGAVPVLLLSKADLESDLNQKIKKTESVAAGAEVITVSSLTGIGMEHLLKYLKPKTTTAIFGSSGVGKSTLINCLLGEERLKTMDIRESDSEGRHTTTWRELIMLPGGALIMDTPGLREVGITSDYDDIDDAFEDIADLAKDCRYRDCSHKSEPGCAVKEAIENGILDGKRFDNYLKILKENRYYERKENYQERMTEKQKWKNISKIQKRMKKNDYK